MAAVLAPIGSFLFGSALRTAVTSTGVSLLGWGAYEGYKHHKQAKATGNEDIPLAPPSQESAPPQSPHESQFTG